MKKVALILAVVALLIGINTAGQALQSAMDTARDAVQSSGGTAGIAYGIDR